MKVMSHFNVNWGKNIQIMLISFQPYLIRLKEKNTDGEFEPRKFRTRCDRRNVISKLPSDVLAETHWYMIVFPHYAKELVNLEDFQSFDFHRDDRSMEGIDQGPTPMSPLYVMFEALWLGTYIESLSGGFR